jgi:uncharacterized protein YhjY with autotransporter beta-barrel domain
MVGSRFILMAALIFASCAGSLAPCAAQTATIGNVSQWNGIDGTPYFGEGGASDATYGQTFVAPAGAGTLSSFSFFLDDDPGTGPVNFQAFVTAWDGKKASGPLLFQSEALTTTDNGGAGGFERINVTISGGLKLMPGTAYVAFFSASNLFDGIPGYATVGTVNGSSYANGGFVFFNSQNNLGALTTQDWDTSFSDLIDLAFEMALSSGNSVSPVDAPPILFIDAAAISSVLISSVPTALAQRELALSASRTTLRDFNGRLFRRRAGEGFAKEGNGQTEDHVVTIGQGDGEEPAQGGNGKKVVYDTLPAKTGGWEAFTSFDYGNFDVDADRNFLGVQSNTHAESVGVERALNRHVAVGAGVSYLESDADHGTDVDGVTLAAYLSGVWGGFYADLLYGATLLDHDIDRNPGFGKTAHGSPHSTTHGVNINTGWNVLRGDWSLGPYLGLDYANANIDGYMETGDGTGVTRVSGQSVNSLISRLGVQVSRHIERSWGSVTPQFRAGWEREFFGSNDDLTVRLLRSPYYLVQGSAIRSTGKGFSATVSGQDRESDWLALGAGVLVRMGAHFSLLLDYEGDLFGSGYTNHFGKISVGWQF